MSETAVSTNTSATSTTTTSAPTNTTTPSSSGGGRNALTARDFSKSLRQAPSDDSETFDNKPVTMGDIESSDEGDEVEPAESEIPEVQEEEVSEEEGDKEDPDAAFLNEMRQFKEIFGLSTLEVLKMLSQGQLHPKLMTTLKVKMKDGAEEWEDTLENARRGAMQRRDYSKKTTALAQEREAFQNEKQALFASIDGWKGDWESWRADLEEMGVPFHDHVLKYAEWFKQREAMTPEARALLEKNEKLQRELNAQKREQEKISKARKAEEQKSLEQKNVDLVSNTAKTLFDESKLPMNKGTWGVFLRNFESISRANPGVPWNEEMVRMAVDLTQDEYQELTAQMKGAPAAKQVVRPAPQQQKTAPASAPAQSPARAQVASLAQSANKTPTFKQTNKITARDFGKMLRGR